MSRVAGWQTYTKKLVEQIQLSDRKIVFIRLVITSYLSIKIFFMATDKQIEQEAFSIEHLKQCKGYNAKFIDDTTTVALDILSEKQKANLPPVDGDAKNILKYSAFSVLMNKKRRLPFVSAANIDGKEKVQIERKGNFATDPRIDEKFQLSNKFYDLIKGGETEFDIGHMTSNNEMCWSDNARLFAYETFHFTNAVPQAPKLNRGLWSGLESYVLDEAKSKKQLQRICVFTGPILKDYDPAYVKDETFLVPLMFWRIVVFKKKDGLHAVGFMMSHEERLREMKLLKQSVKKIPKDAETEDTSFETFPYKKVFQVNIEMIEKLTGLKFKWSKVKRVAVPNDKLQLKKITATTSSDDAKINSKEAKKKPADKVKLNMVL